MVFWPPALSLDYEKLIEDEDYDDVMSSEDQEGDEEMLDENPQPMEVAPAEAVVSTVENQDPEPSKFTLKFENLSNPKKEHYSDVFTVGDSKWQVVIFPKGYNVDYLSMFLAVADPDDLPYGWTRCAQFSLSLVNQINNVDTVRKDTQPRKFTKQQSDWGHKTFLPLGEFNNPDKGYLVDDTCIIEAEVKIMPDDWTYDSRKETGYVGLKNQGATCYMNSLLQTLYHIPYFRKAVYHMPTTENDLASGSSIPLALQTLFYNLQYKKDSVGTKQLTKSFGWNTNEAFMQHDVQELNRILCEKIEDKMKGTSVEGTIQHLFEGHHMNYIECISVEYKSTRKESFYDIQLDVKGCRDVYASFDKYVEVEGLEGDNKYQAGQEHGLQDAKKGVLFIDFPPVLQLQLKRYEYDVTRDTMVKINDRYEFPLQLDLDREDGKYLSPDADKSVRNLYTLQAVLVHSGGGNGGHYYAFIKPTVSEQWFKFNDGLVTKENIKRVLEEQYGGEGRISNAYMLVYIRESNRDEIICNVEEKDIAEQLRIRLKKEQEEKEHKKKEKAEAHLYTTIKVARNEDLSKQIGKDIYFDLVDHEKVRSFRIQKQMVFNVFKEEVAKEFGVPVQFQRFWLWDKHRHETYRPYRPVTLQEESQSVWKLRETSNREVGNAGWCYQDFKLFLEIELGPELHLIPLPCYRPKEDIIIFFKRYDAEKEEIRYVGRLIVNRNGKPLEILKKLNEMGGFSPDEELELYEESKFSPSVKFCKHINKNLRFCDSRLINGDIIWFQKPASADSTTKCRCPDVPSFLEDVSNRRVVHFRSVENPMEDDFCLELSKVLTYDDVTGRVSRHLGLDDPTKIRLFHGKCYSPEPIEYQGFDRLSEVLSQPDNILYYEVLDIPLLEFQDLKTLKVGFRHSTKNEIVLHFIRLPKQSTVGDLINDLKTKVELSHPDAELRLLKVVSHKINKVFPLSEKIRYISDKYWSGTLLAEEIPEEEKNLGPRYRLIHVYHFKKAAYGIKHIGEPFFLAIHVGETLEAVKLRIQKKLQVPDEEFAKWKFAYSTWTDRPEYLEDSDIVASCFERRTYYSVDRGQYLGLDHSDSSPKRAYAASKNLQIAG
ncbi:hypothetical protein MKW98_016058 [Papaver atlanticum]|uniref:ubiquitinyl hydrolase 1 n=1 Tax=Papaver atlanticum TaxID=357466 RepID=A0AAD4T5D9_9MAGN|nr:hypothetical protein MKW98_016058 [Papaver atlanticum]